MAYCYWTKNLYSNQRRMQMHVTKANVTKATRAAAKAAKAVDERINRIYMRNCSGIQIDIMDISKVFKVGREAVANNPGIDDTVLTGVILAFVNTIRKN